MRDRWVVAWLEIDVSKTFAYLDDAIGQWNSLTQSTPGAQYNIDHFATNFEPSGATLSLCNYSRRAWTTGACTSPA